jgi:cytochrome P450
MSITERSITEQSTVEHRVVEGTDIPITDFNPSVGPPRSVGDSVAMYDALRELHPNFIRSTVGPRGFWIATNAAIMREAYQRPDVFSNWGASWFDPEPSYKWIPEHLDPPIHTKWRQLLSPYFSPARVNAIEGGLREQCGALIDSLIERGECDYVLDFSQEFPTTVFLNIFGVPSTELRKFMRWEDEILHSELTEAGYAVSMNAMNEVTEMFATLIAQKRKSPGKDLLSEALSWRIDGETIPDEELLSFSLLMFMAGLDTITNELAYSTWHLATHPEDRARINADPSLIIGAIEEFLRFYPIVTPGRGVTQDIDFHGCPMRKGDIISLPIPGANRDPREFPDADKVIIDRKVNNHIGFGAGPHRCLGSHLARREMRIGLEEWHKRIPDYRVKPGADVPEYIGMQIGIASLPIEWKY